VGWQRESVTALVDYALSIEQMAACAFPSRRIRINPSFDKFRRALAGLRL